MRHGVTSDTEALSVLLSLLLNDGNHHINDETRNLFVTSVAHKIKCSTLEPKHNSEQIFVTNTVTLSACHLNQP